MRGFLERRASSTLVESKGLLDKQHGVVKVFCRRNGELILKRPESPANVFASVLRIINHSPSGTQQDLQGALSREDIGKVIAGYKCNVALVDRLDTSWLRPRMRFWRTSKSGPIGPASPG
jgi:hypothetical protein